MKIPSILPSAAAASLFTLTVGCSSADKQPPPAPPARVAPPDAKDALSPGPHPVGTHAKRAKKRPQAEDAPINVGSPGPHPVNGAPTPTPTPGQ